MKANWGVVAAVVLLIGTESASAADAPPAGAAGVIEHFGLEQSATPVSERPGWRKPKRILVTGGFPGIVEMLQPSAPGAEFVVAKPGEIAKQAKDVDVVDRHVHARAARGGQVDQMDPAVHGRRRVLRLDSGRAASATSSSPTCSASAGRSSPST